MNLLPLWLLVPARVISNPLANVYQKLLTNRGAHPLLIICFTHGLLTVVCFPFLLRHGRVDAPQFWLDMVLCALLAVASNVTLVEALKRSDLSLLGPLNAYKAVVSLIPAIILLGEIPGWPSLIGIALIVSGSYGLTDGSARNFPGTSFYAFFRQRGVQLRIAALVLSATEAVFLKRAVFAGSAEQTFLWWCALGFIISAPCVLVASTRREVRPQCQLFFRNLGSYLLLAVLTGIMQLTTLWVLKELPVASTLALFQTSVLLSVFFGHAIFQEKHLARRLAGAAVMVAGACLIILARGSS